MSRRRNESSPARGPSLNVARRPLRPRMGQGGVQWGGWTITFSWRTHGGVRARQGTQYPARRRRIRLSYCTRPKQGRPWQGVGCQKDGCCLTRYAFSQGTHPRPGCRRLRTTILAIHVRVTRTTTTVVQKAKVSGLTFFSGEGARDPDKPYARGPPAEGRQVEVTGSELPDPAARRPAETSPTRAGAQHDARITRQVDGAQRQCPRNADGSHACCKCLQAQKG